MNNTECRYEQEVLHSVKSGLWNAALREHIATCANCKEMLTVSHTLQTVQENAVKRATAIPAYKYLWLRGQFQNREERLSQLDLVKLLGSSFIGVLALIGVLVWKIPSFSKEIRTMLSGTLPDWLAIIPIGIPLSFAIITVIVIWVYSLQLYNIRR